MLLKQKHSPFYYARFYMGGKQKWISLKTTRKSDAIKVHNELKARFARFKVKSRVNELLGERAKTITPLLILDVEKRYRAINEHYSKSGIRIWRRFREWLAADLKDISEIN
jgi:hypothetical protein